MKWKIFKLKEKNRDLSNILSTTYYYTFSVSQLNDNIFYVRICLLSEVCKISGKNYAHWCGPRCIFFSCPYSWSRQKGRLPNQQPTHLLLREIWHELPVKETLGIYCHILRSWTTPTMVQDPDHPGMRGSHTLSNCCGPLWGRGMRVHYTILRLQMHRVPFLMISTNWWYWFTETTESKENWREQVNYLSDIGVW